MAAGSWPSPTSIPRLAASAWNRLGAAACDLLFPWNCQLCQASGPAINAPFCAVCRAAMSELAERHRTFSCPRCATPVGPFADVKGGCSACRGRPLGFDSAIALGCHTEPWRELVLQMKRERGAFLAPALAALMAEVRSLDFAAIPTDAPIVAIPQHWLRRLSRRYNQAEVLARALADALGREPLDALRRIKPTPRLVGRGRDARAKAVRGAFAPRRGSVAGVKGRTVILVDDVLTTGATLGAAARVLKQAGARRVVAVVVSRER